MTKKKIFDGIVQLDPTMIEKAILKNHSGTHISLELTIAGIKVSVSENRKSVTRAVSEKRTLNDVSDIIKRSLSLPLRLIVKETSETFRLVFMACGTQNAILFLDSQSFIHLISRKTAQ